MKTVSILALLILSFSFAVGQSSGSVKSDFKGKVIDYDAQPLPGVSVQLKSTTIAAMTDMDGLFVISVPDSISTPSLIFSFVGMETQEYMISDTSFIKVTLYEEEVMMEEVVVTTSVVSSEEEYSDYSSESAAELSLSGEVAGVASDRGKRSSRDGLFSTKRSALPVLGSSTEKISSIDSYKWDESSSKDRETEKTEGSSSSADNPGTGLLTAGEINDFTKWELWKDIESTDLKSFIRTWQMKPEQRFCVQVSNNNQQGVPDASVFMLSSFGDTLWAAKTDNTGKAELWANLTEPGKELQDFEIHVENNGETGFVHNPKTFQKGVNFVTLQSDCNRQNNVDIAFVVDATGSMGDEINYLKAEMSDLIQRVEKKYSDINLKTASVFYRDKTDAYLVIQNAFTDKNSETIDFIKNQSAGGGGDFPEAVEVGLDEAINNLTWRKDARSRILFLVLDAPPHQSQEQIDKMQALTKKAAEKGIRIVPITGSGTDKSTEYLMRTLALTTNGTYVFLTDDSGVGGGHIKPTTDKFDVESMNKLLARLLDQYLYLPECIVAETDNVEINDKKADEYTIEDGFGPEVTAAELKIFPNPTTGPVTIKGYKEDAELFLTDMSGKILRMMPSNGNSKIETDFGEFPSGIYFVSYGEGRERKAEKIIIRHY